MWKGGEFSVHCTVRVHQTVRVVLGEGYSVCAGVCMGGGGECVSCFMGAGACSAS